MNPKLVVLLVTLLFATAISAVMPVAHAATQQTETALICYHDKSEWLPHEVLNLKLTYSDSHLTGSILRTRTSGNPYESTLSFSSQSLSLRNILIAFADSDDGYHSDRVEIAIFGNGKNKMAAIRIEKDSERGMIYEWLEVCE